MRASRLLAVGFVLILGLCAAWPYRHPPRHAQEPPLVTRPTEIPLRHTDGPFDATPESDVSPAVELAEAARSQQPLDATPEAPVAPATLDWTKLAPPPALPVSFQPPLAAAPPGQWRPANPPSPTAPASRPPPRPRPYRLRDGDTLERIAERLLGSPQRAGEIFEMNRAVLARPDLLPVGATILIPPRDAANHDQQKPGENRESRESYE